MTKTMLEILLVFPGLLIIACVLLFWLGVIWKHIVDILLVIVITGSLAYLLQKFVFSRIWP